MIRRTLISLALACLATAAVAGSTPEVPPVPVVLEAKEEEARKVIESLDKACAEKNDELLAKSIEEMEGLRSEKFVPYIRNGMKSADNAVIAASFRAAAAHELKDYEKDARKILHAKPSKKETSGLAGETGAAAIDYLARLGIGGEENTIVEEFLEPLLVVNSEGEKKVMASYARDLARASVHYLGKFKSKRAVPSLVSMVGEPQRVQVSPGKGDPNPPEPYWKARAQIWHASEGWVRWALKEITEKTFASSREWEAWLKLNKKDYR